MKPIFRRTIFVVTLAAIVISGCKKKTEAVPEPASTPTPAPTPTAYNLTAKLDGVDYNCSDGSAKIIQGTLIITGHNVNAPTMTGIQVWLATNNIVVQTYLVGEYADGVKATGGYTDMNGGQKDYKCIAPIPATEIVTITKYDVTNKKISGTFNFTVTNDNDATDKKVITSGTFTDISWP